LPIKNDFCSASNMPIRDTIKRFFESMLARWAPQGHDEVTDRVAMRQQTNSYKNRLWTGFWV